MLKIKALEAMINSVYLYNGHERLILSYHNEDGKVIINTSKGTLKTELTNLKDFLKEFVLVRTEEQIKCGKINKKIDIVKSENFNNEVDLYKDKELPILETGNGGTTSLDIITRKYPDTINLVDIVIDNINKVRKNKDFIPQAKSINDSINIILNMARLEISLRKQFKF